MTPAIGAPLAPPSAPAPVTFDAPSRYATPLPPPPSAERLRIVRNITASAAHDLANLLTIMGFHMGRLGAEGLSGQGAEAVRSLRAEFQYLRGLAIELQQASSESEAIDPERQTRLHAWWPDMRALLLAVHSEGVTVRARIPWGLPTVCIRPTHLTQIVLNLVGNAAHAIQDRARTDGPAPLGAPPGRSEIEVVARASGRRRVVVLSVSDNGAGMSPDVLARACEPRFTTRASSGGTGLGLAMIQALIRDIGGSLRLSSAQGVGTTVTLELPTRAPNMPHYDEDESGA